MPFLKVLLGLGQLGDVGGGVLERDMLAGGKWRDQPPSLAIWLEPLRKARRFVCSGGIAARARRTGSAAGACMRAGPWLVRMVLADPTGVFACQRHFIDQSASQAGVE